jgi:diguanylate cyclase (GGDEF)-like protein
MSNNLSEKEVTLLEAIVRIHHSIGAILDVNQIARILVRELSGILNCNACAILLIQGNAVDVAAQRGFSETFGKDKLTTEVPAIKYILTTRESFLTSDTTNSPIAECLPSGCDILSLIWVPILVNNEVKGIIHLEAQLKGAFSKEDLEFAELLAKEVSIAIERSMIFSQVMDTSIKDGLTGCYNRRKLDLDIVAEFAQARQAKKSLSVLMADIDWFKKYNDFHGHQQGDQLLKKLVTFLSNNIRPSDKIYRYGGEEFVIMLPEIGKVKAVYAAKRLQEMVAQKLFTGEKLSQPQGDVTISIGVSSYPADARSWSSLVKAADLALYEAKQTGRNKVCSYNRKSSQD